jgi:hypothetical protein
VPLLDGHRFRGLLVLAFFLLPLHASAELPARVAIEWQRDSACVRSPTLDDEVTRLLGPDFASDESTTIRARVTASGTAQYELDLSVSSSVARSQRRVLVTSCEDANEAAALLIATALDPEAVLRAKEPSAEPSEQPKQPKPAAPSAPSEEPAPPDVSAAGEPGPWALLLKARGDLWSLPGVSGGPVLGVLHAGEHLRFWGEARMLVPREASEGPTSANLSLYTAALGGAYTWQLGPIALGPALAFELGWLRAIGTSDESPRNADALWLEPYAGLTSALQLGRRLALTAELYAGAPIFPPSLARLPKGTPPFYETRPFTLQAALGLQVALGTR